MQYYSKVIAAVVGLLVMVGARYGLNLEGSEAIISDAAIAIATGVSVYLAKNKPTTVEQVKKDQADVTEAKKDL